MNFSQPLATNPTVVVTKSDIIYNFHTETDKLNFDAFDNIRSYGIKADASGDPLNVATNGVIVVTGGAALAAGGTVNAALGEALTGELTFASKTESVVIYNDSESLSAFVYLIANAEGNENINEGEITLLGTVVGSSVAFGDIA